MIENEGIQNVLVVASTDYGDMINPDESFYSQYNLGQSKAVLELSCTGSFQSPQLNAFLWGCGAGAIVVGRSSKQRILRYDAFASKDLTYDSFGIGTATSGHNFAALNGKAIYIFAIQELPPFIQRFVDRNRIKLSQLDAVILHQPNPRILRDLNKRLCIPEDRLLISCDRLGNMIAASPPITYSMAREEGVIGHGSKVLFCSFGDSYLTGAAILTESI